MKKQILAALFFLFSINLMAQEAMVQVNNFRQQDSRIYVEMEYSKTIFGGFQFVNIHIKNNSSDLLRVRLEFTTTSTSGINESMRIGGWGNSDGYLDIKPGQRIGGDVNNCQIQFYGKCGKNPTKVEGGYSCIQEVSYRLISIINISENERAEASRKEKEEAKREADRQQKKELEQKKALERQQAAEQLEKEREQKQRETQQRNAAANQTQQNTRGNYSNSSTTQNNARSNQVASEQQRKLLSNSLITQGNDLANKGDYEAAKAKYNEALNMDPNNITASSNIRIANQNITNKSSVENHNRTLLNSALIEQAGTAAKVELVGKLGGIVSTVIGNIMADRAERKQAEEKQRLARLASEERAEAHKQLVQMRRNLVTGTETAKMPLSSQTHKINEVYFFMYLCDESSLEGNAPVIYLSNIFMVNKYADDTWPFMNTLTGKIEKSMKESKYKLLGYFSSRESADNKLQEFINSSVQYGFTIEDVLFNYGIKSKVVQSNNATSDFWGNPVKKTTTEKSTERTTQPQTDFWGNPIKK